MSTRTTFARAFGRGLLAAAALFGTASLAMAQEGLQLIQNRWTTTQYLNMQAGQPVASRVQTSSDAARWNVEQTGDANAVRLRNIASGSYLASQGGRLGAVASADNPGTVWTLERVAGNPDVRIRSNESGAYLHTKDGPLVLGEASPDWQQSFWKFVPVAAAARAPDAVPVVVPPVPRSGCAARNGRWLWIKGEYVCAHHCPVDTHRVGNQCVPNHHHHCPPGMHHVGNVCVKDCKPGFHPVGKICVPDKKPIVCGPGTHLHNGVCVPNKKPIVCGPGKHLVNGICVPNKKPLPKLCPVGQHLSQGHCCANGKNWNNAQKKCA